MQWWEPASGNGSIWGEPKLPGGGKADLGVFQCVPLQLVRRASVLTSEIGWVLGPAPQITSLSEVVPRQGICLTALLQLSSGFVTRYGPGHGRTRDRSVVLLGDLRGGRTTDSK